MNCQTLRDRLDCMTAEERAADVEVASHLESCVGCREFLATTEQFDQRLSSVLKNVTVPNELLERLLVSVESTPDVETKPEPVTRGIRHSRTFMIMNRLVMAGLAAAVIFAVSSLWSPAPPVTPLDYAVAKTELTETFFRISDSDWEQLSSFDHVEFNIDQLDSSVRKWTLSEPVGIDLGNDVSHDVAAFQFSYERSQRSKWSGTLLVMPTEKFSGTPQQSLPSSSSGMQILEWQSADGSLTYLCFVEGGSADELAGTMFGSIS